MSELLRHPVLPFLLAAVLAPWVGVAGRRVLGLLAPAAALALLISLPADAVAGITLLGHEFVLLRADALARVFAYAFIAYAGVAGVYAWTEESAGARVASLGLAGAGVGVVLAGDLLTLFLFWEWLTVASLFLVWAGGARGSWDAGIRYALFHLLGATVMLGGILLKLSDGAGEFNALGDGSLAAWLILIGMLVNAAVPPLHAWLADAYPRASVYGTVFLAAFTTKAAVYALIRGFPGEEILVWGGTAMALFGVVYAVLENDIRRLLGYHIISQVGYMVAGVGMGSAIALNGAASHAFSHIFYKGLLLMSAGAVIHATGRRKLSELGALAGPLRWVLVLMLIGAASISGVPLFNGFVSKSMVVSAAGYADRGAIELLLLVASMGTFLHTGLKRPWVTFGATDQGARVERPVPRSMYVAMILAAAVCIVTGLAPAVTLYALLPFDYVYHPFTAHHLLESTQLLVGTALGFWLLRAKLGGEPTVTRDVDLLYRGPVAWLLGRASLLLDRAGRRSSRAGDRTIATGWMRLGRYAQAHRNPTVALQTTLIVLALVFAAAGALLLRR